MPIYLNENDTNTEIENINYNTEEIILGKYNGTTVFDNDKLVQYTFPNNYAYMTAASSLGFTAVQDHATTPVRYAWHSFDNLKTNGYSYGYWCAYGSGYSNSSVRGTCIGISFPFSVYLKKITIADPWQTPEDGNAYWMVLKSGTLYGTTSSITSVSTSTTGTSLLSISRPVNSSYTKTYPTGSCYKHVTTHNITANSLMKSFFIKGTFVGGKYNGIGQIKLTFNCKLSDLKAWATKHGIKNLTYTVVG